MTRLCYCVVVVYGCIFEVGKTKIYSVFPGAVFWRSCEQCILQQ